MFFKPDVAEASCRLLTQGIEATHPHFNNWLCKILCCYLSGKKHLPEGKMKTSLIF